MPATLKDKIRETDFLFPSMAMFSQSTVQATVYVKMMAQSAVEVQVNKTQGEYVKSDFSESVYLLQMSVTLNPRMQMW